MLVVDGSNSRTRAGQGVSLQMALDEVRLSKYGQASTEPAPVSRLMADFAATFREGCDINLGVGYVNERTIPRKQILNALGTVLDTPQKYRAALNYGGPVGSLNLIESICRFLLEGDSGLSPQILSRRRIIVGPNGATSLLESVACLVRRGIVLVADPMYYIYCHYLTRIGFEVLAVPENGQGLSAAKLASRLDGLGERRGEVSFIYVITVHNPTGRVLSNGRRRELVHIASHLSTELGRKVPLILDRAYEDLIHDPKLDPVASALPIDDLGIVYEVGMLAKVLAPALRIGFMVAPPGPFIDALVQRTSDAGFSASVMNQEIASYLLDRHAAEQLVQVNRGYRRKAQQVDGWLAEKLGDAVAQWSGGEAGFYFYLTLRDVETGVGSDFFRFLSRITGRADLDGAAEGPKPCVIFIPGQFCVHPDGDLVRDGRRQFRISYGFEELERIGLALDFMAEAIAYARANTHQ